MVRPGPFKGWGNGFFAAAVMALLVMLPQFNLWSARAGRWNGSYAIIQEDEIAYSAYLNALIEGRPRLSDPYSGRDARPNRPLPESHFSIQFVPAYALYALSKLGGLSASSVFILISPICAFLCALIVFWLIRSLTGDARWAAAGALFVLCFGALAGAQGEVRALSGARAFQHLPFARRYQPALSFPLFFLMCGLVWHSSQARVARRALALMGTAGVVCCLLVFSYYFLWTAAVTWLVVLLLLQVTLRPARWEQTSLGLVVCLSIVAVAVLAYLSLVSGRSATMNASLALTATRRPDLLRAPEVIGAGVVFAIGWAVRARRLDRHEGPFGFVLASAVTPFVLFNQQLVTGFSLQANHYADFIANYLALTSVVVTAALLWPAPVAGADRSRRRTALTAIILCSIGWGIFEATSLTNRTAAYAGLRDEMEPVIRHFAGLARSDTPSGTTDPPVILATSLSLAENLPTGSPQAVLWAPAMRDFTGVPPAENKARFFSHLYYSGVSAEELTEALHEGQFYVTTALFGVGRTVPDLSARPEPISPAELQTEVMRYTEFCASFSDERAANPTLSHVVTPTAAEPDLRNLDRWYIRGPGIRVGIFTVYRVRLRQDE